MILRSKAVLLATGTKHRHLGLPREEALTGRGVSYCATCDAMFYKGKTVAVIGYGIQGKAQAANARDSKLKVIVGTRPPEESPSRAQAKADGFESMSIAEATKRADVLLIELADPAQPPIYKAEIAPNLSPGKTLCFCHGFNVLYGVIQPPKDVNTVLFVPNAPGHFVQIGRAHV